MGIKTGRKDKLPIVLVVLLLLLSGCVQRSRDLDNEKGIVVELQVVHSNFPLTDTIPPTALPQLYFEFTFENYTTQELNMSFGDNEGRGYISLPCLTSNNTTISLHPVTSSKLILKKGEQGYKAFKTESISLENWLLECYGSKWDASRGKLLKNITKEVQFIYKDDDESWSVLCKRKSFQSPEYFVSE